MTIEDVRGLIAGDMAQLEAYLIDATGHDLSWRAVAGHLGEAGLDTENTGEDILLGSYFPTDEQMEEDGYPSWYKETLTIYTTPEAFLLVRHLSEGVAGSHFSFYRIPRRDQ